MSHHLRAPVVVYTTLSGPAGRIHTPNFPPYRTGFNSPVHCLIRQLSLLSLSFRVFNIPGLFTTPTVTPSVAPYQCKPLLNCDHHRHSSQNGHTLRDTRYTIDDNDTGTTVIFSNDGNDNGTHKGRERKPPYGLARYARCHDARDTNLSRNPI